MTDSENIKAFECCEANGGQSPQCDACPYHYIDEKNDPCYIELRRAILKILNRQQAEIERLEILNDDLCKIADTRKKVNFSLLKEKLLLTRELKTAKAEAIKEFAERLKAKVDGTETIFTSWLYGYIDYLVKEMVGDAE